MYVYTRSEDRLCSVYLALKLSCCGLKQGGKEAHEDAWEFLLVDEVHEIRYSIE